MCRRWWRWPCHVYASHCRGQPGAPTPLLCVSRALSHSLRSPCSLLTCVYRAAGAGLPSPVVSHTSLEERQLAVHQHLREATERSAAMASAAAVEEPTLRWVWDCGWVDARVWGGGEGAVRARCVQACGGGLARGVGNVQALQPYGWAWCPCLGPPQARQLLRNALVARARVWEDENDSTL